MRESTLQALETHMRTAERSLPASGAPLLTGVLGRLMGYLDPRRLVRSLSGQGLGAPLRDLVAGCADGMLAIDAQGIVLGANPAAERLLGQPAEEIRDTHFFDLMATASFNPPIHGLAEMAATGRPVQIEVTRLDRTSLVVSVSVGRLPDGGTAAFVATLHDVTELSRREAELKLARDQAEAASESKTQFLANMSHELRTPLNAVIGFSEIMHGELLGPIGTESYRGYSGSIHDSATHLLSIINDILDISSIESGTPKLVEELHEPAQLCRSVVALVLGRANQAQVALEVMVDPQIDLLHADGRMVKQMLINLVGNAIKFSPKRGKIEIKVAPTGDGQGGMIFTVRDHGIGIAKEDIPRIMKPFEQVETAFSRNHDGVGLGLPLVNSMARLHGALFTIDSELNQGTAASILFPPYRVKVRPAAAPTATHLHMMSLESSSAAAKPRIRAAE